MSTAWHLADSGGLFGSTDRLRKTIYTPTGTRPIHKAIRLHEALHAITSPDYEDIPWGTEAAFTALEEARIDYMVDSAGSDFRFGIRELRTYDTDQWINQNEKPTQFDRMRAAVMARGYRCKEILSTPTELGFLGQCLSTVATPKVTLTRMLELAYQFTNEYSKSEVKMQTA